MMTSDRARATHVEYNRSRGRARSQFVWMHITGMRRVSDRDFEVFGEHGLGLTVVPRLRGCNRRSST